MSITFPKADEALRDRVRRAYQDAFPDAYVDVSDGYQGRLHVILVSREFDDMPERERQSILHGIARETMGDEAQRLSLLLAYSPDELK